MKHYQAYINGKWVDAPGGEKIEVANPANGEVYATIPACTKEQAIEALETSKVAQQKWKDLPPVERGAFLYAISDKLKNEKEHFAKLLVMEQGKTLNEARFEVDDTIRYMTYSAEAARRIEGNILPSDSPNEQLYIYKVPYGVTVGLCAFNYPLALIGRKVGPALITGNTMVLKPHELTPTTASEFCRLCEEVGLPKGVINMITGTTAEVATTLVESPLTQLITVTGSIRAGQSIYAAAAKNITALSLELGGKAPFIICEDADIDLAVEAAAVARFANCGQVCICNESVFVHEKIAVEFTEKLIKRVGKVKLGDPMKNIGMGPSTSKIGLDRIFDIVNKTVAEGAEIAIGGKRPEGKEFENGNWMEPTVLINARPEMTAFREEIFGPVMPVATVSSYEEAVFIANQREDGLSAYLFTKNYGRMMHAVNNLETGTIFINKGIVGYIQGYHNGHKRSGVGGEDGVYGIEGYLQKRTVYMAW